ncbi:MAG: type IV pilus modification PilV family protein [Candidatus Saccharimonadales bacterium]
MAFKQRGDTLVEVLMAIVIMSVVIVGAITMMSRGLAAAQIALEHSQVRLSINGQTELLRYLRDQYVIDNQGGAASVWRDIITTSNEQPSQYGDVCRVTPVKATSAFYLEKANNQVQKQAFDPSREPATAAVAGEGLWIEAAKSPNGISPAYTDFVIRACWQASGSGGEQRTVTAVRLYDPSR